MGSTLYTKRKCARSRKYRRAVGGNQSTSQSSRRHARIPKVIYQTWETKELPENIQRVRDTILHSNPGYTMVLHDQNDRDEFIKSNFDTATYNAYTSLKLGAAKADLWRYCILYKNGGIYLDMDANIVKPLDDLIRLTDACIITRENNKNFFAQWCLIFKKKHPVLKETIRQCIHNIQHKTSTDTVSVTGPLPYATAINKVLLPHYSKKVDTLYAEPDSSLNKELNVTGNPFQSRFFGIDMNGFMEFKNTFSGDLYTNGVTHWREQGPVID